MLMLRSDMHYSTGQKSHFDFCDTFEVSASGLHTVERYTSEHPGWEILFLPIKAEAMPRMEIRGRAWDLRPHSFLLYNGGEVHTEVYGNSVGCHKVSALVLMPSFLRSFLEPHGISADELIFDSIFVSDLPRVLAAVRKLMGYREITNVSRVTYDCLISEIASELLITQCHSNQNRIKKLASYGRFPGNLQKAKKTMCERVLDASLSIEDVASAAGLSKFHFIRTFKTHLGATPNQYLNSLRIDHAKASIERGRSILDAAYSSGFASVSTFNKAYKRATGHSPQARKENLIRRDT